MAKILVLGGHAESLGGVLQDALDDCAILSRRTDPPVNVLDPASIEEAIAREKPETVICAAMTLPNPSGKHVGRIEDWSDINLLLDTKIKGTYIALNATARHRVRNFIVMAGSAVSDDPRMCYFAAANGALWGMVQFANRHTFVRAHYLEMGVVLPSQVGELYLCSLASELQDSARVAAISPDNVSKCIRAITEGKFRGEERILLNKGMV